MSDEVILKCENLHKNFRKKEILKGVSLEVCSGDILGFIGPNGAGKTTTIKLILGLQNITSGKVTINGFDIKSNFEKAIQKVGAIIENPDLYMYLSGYDNLKLIAKLYPNIDENRIKEVIHLVGLENRIQDKVSKYSLGMRQRLGVAQAILHKPNLLILDEPTNGLDPEGIRDLRNLLTNLAQKEKMGILISSHNLAEIETLCNKVCIIQNGSVIENTDMVKVKETAQIYYHFTLNSTEQLEEYLSYPMEIQNETEVRMNVTKQQVPEIVKALVKHDIKIYEIHEEQMSLEDAFLKKTGGNTID